MNAAVLEAKTTGTRGSLAILVAGRVLLILCSVASIRIATQILGSEQVGVMHLILSAITLTALLVGSFSLYFYRQLLEWHAEGRLLANVGRYGRFLLICAMAACAVMVVPYIWWDDAWREVPFAWLGVLLAGNLVITTLNGALLYALNVLGKQRLYVLLSNVAAWGGVTLAAGANTLAGPPRAEHWLAGLLAAQVFSLVMAWFAFVATVRGTAPSAPAVNPRADDFRFASVLRFSWPLVLCTGLYWLQRNSFAPFMADIHDTRTLGLFSVGFSVGFLVMSSFDTLFREYYAPTYYKAITGGNNEAKVLAFNAYAHALFPAVVAMTVFVAAAGHALLRLLVSAEFHGMTAAVAWGALSQALISIYSTYVLLASSFMDNRILILPNAAGAAVALGLMALLLPLHPVAGAGLAIVLGLLTTTALVAWRLNRLHRQTLPLRRMSAALLLSVPLAAVPLFEGPLVPFVVLALAGLYAAGLQYRLAKPWL